MSYETFETGAGRPVELYLFERDGVCWPYTSSDMAHVFQGLTYQPVTISRSAFERDEDTASSRLKVRLDRVLKVCAQFIDGSTPSPVKLTVYRKHRNDTGFIVLFTGRVSNAELEDEEITLECQSPLGTDEKSIPRHLILRTCPHVLYGPRCALDKRDWDENVPILAVSGNVVTLNNVVQAAGYYTAGVIKHDDSGFLAFVQRDYISGGRKFVLLQTPPSDWGVSDTVTIYAGCDRKHTTCRDKFNNIPNFGGFPLHPERDPFIDLKGT